MAQIDGFSDFINLNKKFSSSKYKDTLKVISGHRGDTSLSLDGASVCVDLIREEPFYASLWQVTIHNGRIAVASNVGSVK